MWNLWKLLLFLRWMCHHYCAMLMSLISLTWEIKGQPDCSRKQVCNFFSFHYILYIMNVHNLYTYSQRGVELFLCWAIMQGFAMMLQNRYQRQRLYTRIALGKVTYFSDQKTNWYSMFLLFQRTFWYLFAFLWHFKHHVAICTYLWDHVISFILVQVILHNWIFFFGRLEEWTLCGERLLVLKVNCCYYALSSFCCRYFFFLMIAGVEHINT